MRLLLASGMFSLLLCGAAAGEGPSAPSAPTPQRQRTDRFEREPHGAIVRGDATAKRLALVFTGDERGEGAAAILDALAERRLKATFFLTGNFLRIEEHGEVLRRMLREGHYVGPHSDGHLLYAAWEERDRSLVNREQFRADLEKNIADLRRLGALGDGAPVYFMPPYEWYNREQAAWCEELDVRLVNFTPGSGSNRDYAREGDKRFVSSRQIYDDILAYERREPRGLGGFLLLLHVGSGRLDPFHPRIGALCDELVRRGYELVRLDELLAPVGR